MFRKHILCELNENKIVDLKTLLDLPEVISECYGSKKNKGLKHFWHLKWNQEIPEILKYLDNLDISYCYALIQNVFKNKEQTIFKYCDNKSKYVEQLRIIRNEEYGHMLLFETDDLRFSITVVKLEEIIRQLWKHDSKVSKDFLYKIETVLDRDSFQIDDKVKMLTVLTEQKELFEGAINNLVLKLEKSTDKILKSFNERLTEFQKSIINNSINIQQFEELINEMKSTKESRKILLEIVSSINSNVSKILEIQDEIKSDLSRIGPKIDEKTNEILSSINELPDKIVKKEKENSNGI